MSKKKLDDKDLRIAMQRIRNGEKISHIEAELAITHEIAKGTLQSRLVKHPKYRDEYAKLKAEGIITQARYSPGVSKREYMLKIGEEPAVRDKLRHPEDSYAVVAERHGVSTMTLYRKVRDYVAFLDESRSGN